MPTVKGSYEAVLIYSVKAGEEAVEALKEKFASLIAANAEAGEVDDEGKTVEVGEAEFIGVKE